MPKSLDLAELIDLVMREKLSEVRVALPGEVVAYDASLQEADVQPLVKRRVARDDGTETEEPLPIIPHVPVLHMRGGGFHASFPLSVGDQVLLVFSDTSVDDVRAGRGAAAPSDRASHHLANAVCYPGGAYPTGEELSDSHGTDLIIGEDGGNAMRIAPGGPVRLGSQGGGEEFVALATKVLTELQSIRTQYNLHTHTGVTTGGGVSGVPAALMTAPNAVAASNVKAD